MPMTAAHARKLVKQGKARFVPHYALTIVQLERTFSRPVLRPVVAGVAIHFNTAEIFLLADGPRKTFPLVRLVIDLRTDLPWRMRRRTMFRQRRKLRRRYRAPRRHGLFCKRRGSASVRRPRFLQKKPAAVIQWRAQAIERVLKTLCRFIPLSHVMLLEPHSRGVQRSDALSPSERRQQLIAAYGQPDARGKRKAVCAYCGTVTGMFVVDHIVPQSRGGTDIWSNLVLACKACNDRKADRTPEEAGMPLLIQPTPEPVPAQRVTPYVRQTARKLVSNLETSAVAVHWLAEVLAEKTTISPHVQRAMSDFVANAGRSHTLVANPITRPRKQVFTAHNYPLDTPLQPGFVRVGQTVKRRVQVNRGIALLHKGRRTRAQVVAAGEEPPAEPHQFVTIGMLCSAQRAGRTVVGIVRAVHSDCRLTLQVPVSATRDRVQWKRVVVSPRRNLRVLSSDSVVFLSPEE